MTVLRLKEVLSEKDMTGKDLAAAVGVTPVSISNIVQGNSFPKPDLLLKICSELDVDIRELFHPTKGGALLNGFVEYQGKVHSIKSLGELEKLLEIVKNKNH
nr:helix-turn-helix transcriptional regulator [uncultured Allomuricauda sp.]